MSLKIAKINFSIPAGQTQEFGMVADFYRLDTLPSGLLVGLNGGPAIALTEGFSQQGVPGQGEVRLLRIENPTSGTLSGAFSHGTGEMSLPGVAAVIGTIALPSGASTAANQATANGYLLTLSQPRATLHEAKNFAGGGAALVVPSGARYVAVLNTHASLSVTVEPTGGTSFTLAPGQGVDWPLLPVNHAGGYPATTISGAAGATANVAYIV